MKKPKYKVRFEKQVACSISDIRALTFVRHHNILIYCKTCNAYYKVPLFPYPRVSNYKFAQYVLKMMRFHLGCKGKLKLYLLEDPPQSCSNSYQLW